MGAAVTASAVVAGVSLAPANRCFALLGNDEVIAPVAVYGARIEKACLMKFGFLNSPVSIVLELGIHEGDQWADDFFFEMIVPFSEPPSPTTFLIA